MKNRRMSMWWIRWEDLNWPDHDNADRIRRRAEALARADVTTVIDFGTHFRWDYLPYFELLHDYLARVAEACHKLGMEFYDHHSVNLVHRYHNREEMRHVMLHSGPHLPFSPSFEAAESWTWRGKKLNDWRMIDVKTREPLYFPQYAGEGFCYRNPAFIESYLEYAKKLVADTGIDGLMADDAVYYMHYNACACPACRAELRRRAGVDLPPAEDTGFWGNYDNPAWRAWIDLRYDACGEFMEKLRAVLPEKFELLNCGGHSDAGKCNSQGTDARQFARAVNHINLEISGNTPPYKKDPVTVNLPVSAHIISGLHHEGVAREKGLRCFGTGYGFSKPSANVIWAVNKMCGSDAWFGTLKQRLGLPRHILDSLPDEGALIGDAFAFEKAHGDLFTGDRAAQMGLYFSYETRNHTLFGNKESGYPRDFAAAVKLLAEAGISFHVIFDLPADAKTYPLVLMPSPLSLTEEEERALDRYLAAGGKAVAAGPAGIPGAKSGWKLPNAVKLPPDKFFSTVRDGVWMQQPAWMNEPIPDSGDEDAFTELRPGLWYNPLRISGGKPNGAILSFCRDFGNPLPVKVKEQTGYLVSVFETEDALLFHFLAADFETEIDQKLDDMRFHRSRVNLITKAEPAGVGRTLLLESRVTPRVFLPFREEDARVEKTDGGCRVTLPEKCAYAILSFPKDGVE
ncbi:MAG: hypothetical protein J6Z79_02555 [Clostridia bacterium]|nr:hypothetical protein [Clostridia bacterium]